MTVKLYLGIIAVKSDKVIIMVDKTPIGALVKIKETNTKGVVVGYEQGGRTARIVYRELGATMNRFHKDLEVLSENPSTEFVWKQAYEAGKSAGNKDTHEEWAESVAKLIEGGHVSKEGLIKLFGTIGEKKAISISNKLGDD
ncbi:MAG: hypothetical protein J07AB43_01880 [Candidatus Nanosalina sp. J07AB43]|nr:MAG: hypothetical protein J07AB43_01880 [Candidatus Nanosalina sp. J07AB43]